MRRADRSYREVTLDNGLRAMLSSSVLEGDRRQNSKILDESGICFTVGVGRFSDPEDIPGLSRLVERTMFRGSEKYPDASGFDSFVKQYGGESSSQTLPEDTKFNFSVKTKYFEETLERFADMLKKPLLRDDDAYHEIEVLESEWSHRKQALSFIFNHMIMMHMAMAGHPMSRFGCGNKMSLDTIPKSKGINVPAMARQFYKQHYSGDIMTIVIVSGKSLDELEKYLRDYFSDIPVVAGAGKHVVGSEYKSSDKSEVPKGKEEELGATGTNSPKDLQGASNYYQGGRLDEKFSKSGVHYFSHGDSEAQGTDGTASTSSDMVKLFNQTWGDDPDKLSSGVHNDEFSSRVSPSADYDSADVTRNLLLGEVRDERERCGGAKHQKGAKEQHKGAEEQQEGAEEQHKGAEEQQEGAEEQYKGAEEHHQGAEEQHKGAEEQPMGAEELHEGAEEQQEGSRALKDLSNNQAQPLGERSGETEPLKEENGAMALEEHLKRAALEDHHKGAVALMEVAE